ncbi:MAG: hypothetical protein ABIL01_10455 [Pseudomonadota bacterium]
MRIPVFVSAPTQLNPAQKSIYDGILELLEDLQLERRALGRSDYPTEFPLKEVIRLARKCSGGLILGFVQQSAAVVVSKPGTAEETSLSNVCYPTPWNHLEAGILFSLKLPTLVFKETGIGGGVFDNGVTDLFVHRMPTADECRSKSSSFREVILRWQGRVRETYYED